MTRPAIIVLMSGLPDCALPRILLAALVLACVPARAGGAEIPIKGGCALGESQLAHGLAPADAQARIIQYARLYVQSYASYNRQQRDARRNASEYLELKSWTQEDIIAFTRQQRELLYISIGGELATSKIDTNELPGYVAAIDQRIQDIEIELGCERLAADGD